MRLLATSEKTQGSLLWNLALRPSQYIVLVDEDYDQRRDEQSDHDAAQESVVAVSAQNWYHELKLSPIELVISLVTERECL
jgi:hypothetical protein